MSSRCPTRRSNWCTSMMVGVNSRVAGYKCVSGVTTPVLHQYYSPRFCLALKLQDLREDSERCQFNSDRMVHITSGCYPLHQGVRYAVFTS